MPDDDQSDEENQAQPAVNPVMRGVLNLWGKLPPPLKIAAAAALPVILYENVSKPSLVFPNPVWRIPLPNNCYSYALNDPLRFAQPYNISRATTVPYTCEDLVQAALKDGLVHPLTEDANGCDVTCPDGYHAVLPTNGSIESHFYKGDDTFVKKSHRFDYHFYRQDNDGSWSSKDGFRWPTDRDGSDDKIFCPKEANHVYKSDYSLGGITAKTTYAYEPCEYLCAPTVPRRSTSINR